jgi:predicted RNase H-like HicB family nuclease
MQKKPDEILKAQYSRVLIPEEDGTFSAEILEFPGCFAQGETANEAFNNLEEAAKVWIEASLAQGLNIPSPALNQSYSGKIALRIPRSLHKRAAQMAARDATSLNQFLITAIASRIGAEEYHAYLCNNFENLLASTISNNVFIRNTLQQNFVTINTRPTLYYNIQNTDPAQTEQYKVLDSGLTGNIGLSNYKIHNLQIGLIPQETKIGR